MPELSFLPPELPGDVKISFRFSGLAVSGAGAPVPLNGDENKPMLALGSP